jgi:hypothetical protein
MKLHELGSNRPTEQVAKVFESILGDRVDFSGINRAKARRMLDKVQALVREHKNSPSRHYSERNPDYMRLVMMGQALTSVISEGKVKELAADIADSKMSATNFLAKYKKTKAAAKKEISGPKEKVKEAADVTDYNPKSQGGSRKELLAKYAKSGSAKHAEAARRAGATQAELKSAKSKALGEAIIPGSTAAPGAPAVPGTPQTPQQADAAKKAQAAQSAQAIAATKDPKLKMALGKAAKGQNLNPDEQKQVAGAALMKTEARLRRRLREENELQKSQTILAMQDMVDRIQKMTEDVSEMQFKDLPAIVQTLKNEGNQDQATQLQTSTSAALTQLLQSLQEGKTQMEQSQGILTGQASQIPGMDAGAAPGGLPSPDDLDGADGMGGEPELPLMPDDDEDELPAVKLGRERR